MTDEYCTNCVYYTLYDQVCNYNVQTGYSRRCPSGTGCTKKVPVRCKRVKDAQYHRELGEYHAVTLRAKQNIIREYRQRHGLSMEAFGKLVGRKKQTVCNWERGWYHCPPEILEKVRNDEQF